MNCCSHMQKLIRTLLFKANVPQGLGRALLYYIQGGKVSRLEGNLGNAPLGLCTKLVPCHQLSFSYCSLIVAFIFPLYLGVCDKLPKSKFQILTSTAVYMAKNRLKVLKHSYPKKNCH